MNIELQRRRLLAEQEIGRSVVCLAPIKLQHCGAQCRTFGIKNTAAIPHAVLSRLMQDGRYTWLTIDKMADKGRSIDTDLINPITYRLMTGSTSGGALSVLKGINDFVIGTDGGGSVLGPAAAVNLYSLIGAGLGDGALARGSGDTEVSISTDGLAFYPSLGIISKSLDMTVEAFSIAAGVNLEGGSLQSLRIAVPAEGSVRLPDGLDMSAKLNPYIAKAKEIEDLKKVSFENFDLTGIKERTAALEKLNAAFDAGFDMLITFEGPVDVYAYDETISVSFSGSAVNRISGDGGKYLIRAANMAKSSAISLPTNEIASALIICAKPGLAAAQNALALARIFDKLLTPAPLFKRYFLDQQKKNLPFDVQYFSCILGG